MQLLRIVWLSAIAFATGACSSPGDPESSSSSTPSSSSGRGTGSGRGEGGRGEDAGAGAGRASSTGSGGDGGAAPSGDPLFIAVGYGGRRIASSDGESWAHEIVEDANGGDDDSLFRGAGYGDGVFVAAGGAAHGRTVTTRDGITWDDEITTHRAFVSDVAYEGGTFVAVGGNGYRARSHDMGTTWTDDPGYWAGHFRAVAQGGGVFVAVGHSEGGEGATSTTTDGAAWTPPKVGGSRLWAVAYGNGVFVACGEQGRCSASADGLSWTDQQLGDDSFRDVRFVDGVFLAHGESGATHTSTHGGSWQSGAAGMPAHVVSGAGAYVGTQWPGQLLRSQDMTHWTEVGESGPSFTDVVLGYVAEVP